MQLADDVHKDQNNLMRCILGWQSSEVSPIREMVYDDENGEEAM